MNDELMESMTRLASSLGLLIGVTSRDDVKAEMIRRGVSKETIELLREYLFQISKRLFRNE